MVGRVAGKIASGPSKSRTAGGLTIYKNINGGIIRSGILYGIFRRKDCTKVLAVGQEEKFDDPSTCDPVAVSLRRARRPNIPDHRFFTSSSHSLLFTLHHQSSKLCSATPLLALRGQSLPPV